MTELPPGLRVLEAVQEIARSRGSATRTSLHPQLAERFGFAADAAVDAGRRPLRRRAAAAAAAAAAHGRAERAAARRAHQRPRHRHAHRAGGPARRLRRARSLVVSHDRYFVDRVCDTVVALLGDGSLAALPGGVEEYLARRAAGEAQLHRAGAGRGRSAAAGGPAVPRRCGRGAPPAKEAARLERRLEKLNAEEERLHAAAGRRGDRPRAGARARRPAAGACSRRRTRSRATGWPPAEVAEG